MVVLGSASGSGWVEVSSDTEFWTLLKASKCRIIAYGLILWGDLTVQITIVLMSSERTCSATAFETTADHTMI